MRFSRSKGSRGKAPARSRDVQKTSKSKAATDRPTADQSLLWTVTIMLFAVGAVMVYSASSATSALQTDGDPLGYLKRYLLFGAVGLILMRFATRIDLDRLRRLTPVVLIIAFSMLVLVLMPGFGVEVNGARRWLGGDVLRFQPSEMMKLALVLYTAMLVAQKPQRVRELGSLANPLFWVVGAAGVLIMLQPDMGTDLLIGATIMLILISAGARIKDLALVIGALALVVLAASLLEPYRMARLTAFFDPGSDPTGIGYQSEQARIAIGSGGLFGVGLGESVQKVFYMPEAHTDMILAVIGEELGLLGIAALAALYFVLVMIGLRAAKNSRDVYARLLAIGVTSMIASQALLNFFAVLGMAPLTGVPLPFISYGGANLIIMLIAMGLLINVASGRHAARVRVLGGGGRQDHDAAVSDRHWGQAVASAGQNRSRRAGGRYEDRGRSRRDGRSRRSSPRRS